MYTLFIGAPPQSFEQVRAFVERVADDFGRAFALGFFEPAALEAPIVVRSHPPTRLAVEIRATQCPPGLLRILWGMCEWGREREEIPLQWLGVEENGTPLHLESTTVPSFARGRDHAFRLARPRFIGFGDQMVVLTEFARPLDDQQVELLERGLHTWEALMFGGLPPKGSSPGESAIGATSGYFIMPATYQWFVEGLAADSGSVDLLVNFFDVQAARLQLSAVDVES